MEQEIASIMTCIGQGDERMTLTKIMEGANIGRNKARTICDYLVRNKHLILNLCKGRKKNAHYTINSDKPVVYKTEIPFVDPILVQLHKSFSIAQQYHVQDY